MQVTNTMKYFKEGEMADSDLAAAQSRLNMSMNIKKKLDLSTIIPKPTPFNADNRAVPGYNGGTV